MALQSQPPFMRFLRDKIVQSKNRVILKGMDDMMFYLAVDDTIVCWSNSYIEIANAYDGHFTFSEASKSEQAVETKDASLARAVSKMNPPNSMTMGYETFKFFAEPETVDFGRKRDRLVRAFSEALAALGTRRERIEDLRALNRKLDLKKVQAVRTWAQLKAYEHLLASWKLREKAGL